MPNRTTYADLTAESVYNYVAYSMTGLFTEGTFAFLAHELLADDTIRIYAARYVATPTPALQIISLLTPNLQDMSGIINTWTRPGLIFEEVIWSTTNITNIHAKMFYYDQDADVFRCIRGRKRVKRVALADLEAAVFGAVKAQIKVCADYLELAERARAVGGRLL